jgi:hypothetical protein
VAVADDFVQLVVGQLKEALRFTVAIVGQPIVAQDRILESDGYWRAIHAHRIPLGEWAVLRAFKGRKNPIRLAFQQFSPAFEALGSGHAKLCWVYVDLSNRVHLVHCLVPHGNLL